MWNQIGDVDWHASFSDGGRILWDATYELYMNVFEPNADHTLDHLNEGTGNFQSPIYMFWDAARWYAGAKVATDRQRADFLRICERALASPKASVQESALHGLGHAADDLPGARQAIARFLSKGKPRRKELRTYAETALTGGIE